MFSSPVRLFSDNYFWCCCSSCKSWYWRDMSQIWARELYFRPGWRLFDPVKCLRNIQGQRVVSTLDRNHSWRQCARCPQRNCDTGPKLRRKTRLHWSLDLVRSTALIFLSNVRLTFPEFNNAGCLLISEVKYLLENRDKDAPDTACVLFFVYSVYFDKRWR